MNKLTQWILNITAFIFFFVFFVVVFFPLDSVIRNVVMPQIEKSTNGDYQLDFKELDASLLFGSIFSELSLMHREQQDSIAWIKLPKVKVKLNYFSLIVGTTSVDFKVEGDSLGNLSGNWNTNGNENEVTLHLDNFGLGAFPVLRKVLPLNLTGRVSGDVTVKAEMKKNGKLNGAINLTFKDFKTTEANLPVNLPNFQGASFAIPAITMSDAGGGSLKMTLLDKKWELEEFKMPGPDIEIDLKGRIQKSSLLIQSRPTINGTFKFSPELVKSLPLKTAGIDVGTDGSLAFSMSGTFDGLRLKLGTKEFSFGRASKKPTLRSAPKSSMPESDLPIETPQTSKESKEIKEPKETTPPKENSYAKMPLDQPRPDELVEATDEEEIIEEEEPQAP